MYGDSDHRGEVIGSLHELLLHAEDLDELLTGVAVLACKLAPAAGVCVLTVDVAGRTLTASSSDGEVPAVPSYSARLASGDISGRLNLYVDEGRRTLDQLVQQRVDVLAEQAGPVVALAVRRAAEEKRNDQLTAALSSRTVIDQAIGVLMAQERCSAERAFDLLRQHSQNTNRKLRDVAAEIITRTTGHLPSDPTPFA
jgi:hypothetical protein